MRTTLFWVIAQRVVVISYRRSGQPIGLIFCVQDSWKVGKKLPLLAA